MWEVEYTKFLYIRYNGFLGNYDEQTGNILWTFAQIDRDNKLIATQLCKLLNVSIVESRIAVNIYRVECELDRIMQAMDDPTLAKLLFIPIEKVRRQASCVLNKDQKVHQHTR